MRASTPLSYLILLVVGLLLVTLFSLFLIKQVQKNDIEELASYYIEQLSASKTSVCLVTTKKVLEYRSTKDLYLEVRKYLYNFLQYAHLENIDDILVENINPIQKECTLVIMYIPLYDLGIEDELAKFFDTPSPRVVLVVHPLLSFYKPNIYVPSPILPKYFGFQYSNHSISFYRYKGRVFLDKSVFGTDEYILEDTVYVYKVPVLKGTYLVSFYPIEEERQVLYPMILKYTYKDKVVIVPLVPVRYWSETSIRYLLYIIIYKELRGLI